MIRFLALKRSALRDSQPLAPTGFVLALLIGASGCSSVELGGLGEDIGDSNVNTSAGTEDEEGESEESEASTGEDDGGTSDDLPPDESCEESCDPWDLSSCEEGFKCTPVSCMDGDYRVEEFSCRPVVGDAQAGDSCQLEYGGGDTCDLGLVCWQVDEATGIGHCEPMCAGAPEMPECGEERVCAMFGQAGLALCVPTCDPIFVDCPSDDSTCLPLQDAGDFACFPDASEGGGLYGESCEFSNACAPGLYCVDPTHVPEPACEDSVGCCTEFCELGSVGTCSGEGQECVPFAELPGNADFEAPVGICSAALLPSGAEPETPQP